MTSSVAKKSTAKADGTHGKHDNNSTSVVTKKIDQYFKDFRRIPREAVAECSTVCKVDDCNLTIIYVNIDQYPGGGYCSTVSLATGRCRQPHTTRRGRNGTTAFRHCLAVLRLRSLVVLQLSASRGISVPRTGVSPLPYPRSSHFVRSL